MPMKHLYWIVLTLWLLRMLAFAQPNPHTTLHDALVLENRGSFEMAAEIAKGAIDSRQLSGTELGRGYIILAVACRGAGDLASAQVALEHALQVLEHDREHPEDYASALENYAELYCELGQGDVAAPMWQGFSSAPEEWGAYRSRVIANTLGGTCSRSKSGHFGLFRFSIFESFDVAENRVRRGFEVGAGRGSCPSLPIPKRSVILRRRDSRGPATRGTASAMRPQRLGFDADPSL